MTYETKRERKEREKREKQEARKKRAYERAQRVMIVDAIFDSKARGTTADAFRSAKISR